MQYERKNALFSRKCEVPQEILLRRIVGFCANSLFSSKTYFQCIHLVPSSVSRVSYFRKSSYYNCFKPVEGYMLEILVTMGTSTSLYRMYSYLLSVNVLHFIDNLPKITQVHLHAISMLSFVKLFWFSCSFST